MCDDSGECGVAARKPKKTRATVLIRPKTQKRAKGLEPSTSSLGSSDRVVLSPVNKGVMARRSSRCTGGCTNSEMKVPARLRNANRTKSGRLGGRSSRAGTELSPDVLNLAARLATLSPEVLTALQALFNGPTADERPVDL